MHNRININHMPRTDKTYLYIALCLLLLVPSSREVCAQEPEQEPTFDMEYKGSPTCEIMRKRLGYPYYYCDCSEQSSTFIFPLDALITDTVWFKADISDLLKGMSAYWFADCGVQMDVYAMCASKEPTMTLRVGKNQMREMDATSINEKLAAMGSAGEALKNIKPRIRVYPTGTGSGRVLCYPYNEGPHSTCNDLLPVYTSMTYVSSHSYDVYELQPQSIPSSGTLFVQWKQKDNQPCTVSVHRGGCEGAVVATTLLADSTKLYFPDKTLLQQVKKAGESLYFRFEHEQSAVGRISFRVPKYVAERVDTTICQGMGLQLADTLLTATTVYPNDTVWLLKDTVALRTYHLTIAPAPVHYDTLRVRSTDLPMLYRNKMYIRENGYGDYDYTEQKEGMCDERYLLCVEHAVQTTTTTIDTTLCEGKIYSFAGKNYTTNTEIQDTVWSDADTRSVVDLRVTFTEPELEYDTLYLTAAQLEGEDGYGYYHAESMQYITAYGDIEYDVTARNRCTRRVRLTVLEDTMTPTGTAVAEEKKPVVRYNLLGQKVSESYRGVVIENGRLVWRE